MHKAKHVRTNLSHNHLLFVAWLNQDSGMLNKRTMQKTYQNMTTVAESWDWI